MKTFNRFTKAFLLFIHIRLLISIIINSPLIFKQTLNELYDSCQIQGNKIVLPGTLFEIEKPALLTPKALACFFSQRSRFIDPCLFLSWVQSSG